MNTLLRRARGIKAMVTLTRDPNRLEDVFTISNDMVKPELVQKIVEHVKLRADYSAAAFDDRPRVGLLDLDSLAGYPAGTLGHEFARHMKVNGLDPSALPTVEDSDDTSYVHAHLIETHDIWHVVTGFEADVAGELGLQAFYLAQFPSRLAGIILAGGMLNTVMFNFDDRERRLDAIARGWTMGKTARPFFGVRWNELWSEPLADVRARFQVAGAVV